MPPNLIGRYHVEDELRRVAPGRVAFYGIENSEGTPIYVHAKACVIDDTWASVGSDNFNRRSWTHDSELSAAVCHPDYACGLRAVLAREHLGLEAGQPDAPLEEMFDAFAAAAAHLQAWHDNDGHGPRPPGQLRPLARMPLGRLTRMWATPLYRVVYDPDGRPLRLRLRNRM
jgi:phosphatidylserine/phosphatidylglycerophosphate/cardiolipin synthase-like enzyme